MSDHTPGPWRQTGAYVMAKHGSVALCDVGGALSKETEEANARLIAAAPANLDHLRGDAMFFDTVANTLDGWAEQSRTGGWSTHQVLANLKLADDCRRRAAIIRAAIAKATGEA